MKLRSSGLPQGNDKHLVQPIAPWEAMSCRYLSELADKNRLSRLNVIDVCPFTFRVVPPLYRYSDMNPLPNLKDLGPKDLFGVLGS